MVSDNSSDQIEPYLRPSVAIAAIKVKLVENVALECTRILERDLRRNLKAEERDAVTRRATELIAQLPPQIFKIDPNWEPASEPEIRRKLTELKFDEEFRSSLRELVLERMRGPQKRILDFH